MRKILCVGFRTQVTCLTTPLERWSKRKGEHDPVSANSSCIELDNRDLELTWTGGSVPRKIVVPRENVAYVEYDAEEAPKGSVKK